MGKCKHHPQSSDGVCSSCLEKKLNLVWRGESRLESAPAASGIVSDSSKEAIAVLGSIASITKRKQSSSKLAKGRDITERPGIDFVLDSRYADGVTPFRKPAVPPSVRVNIDGEKGRNKRRSKMSSSVSKKVVVGKSVALADAKAGLNAFAGARSMGCRSLPMVDKIAKETALRVIREVGDEDLSEEEVPESTKEQDPQMACFVPSHWQSKLRSKWGLRGLVGSPMITGGNKIFPSRSVENVQKLLQAHFSPLREDSRFVSAGDVDRPRRGSDLRPSLQAKLALSHESHELDSDVVIEGMPDRILKPEDMNQRLRTSYNTVLKWLQDLPMPETTLQDMDGDDAFSSSFAMEVRNTDLAKVGHLHEIAEEHENSDESSVEKAPIGNHLRDVSSFGKFLIRAAQRKPKQGLSRVASAR